MAQIPQMRSIGLLDDLSPEQQAQRQQDVYMGLLQAPAYGAMMMPLSGIYETTGQMPDPANPSQKLPSTAELIRRGDIEGLGYQGLGVLGDVMYAASPVAPFLAPMAAGLKGTAATSRGIRAYHGSPHHFDKFKSSAIGTGEGAQAYGHGLYFSDSEGIAKNYRDNLAQNTYTLPSGQKQPNMTVGDGEVLHNYFDDELNHAMFTRPDRGNVDLTNRYAAKKLGSNDGAGIKYNQQSDDTRRKIRDSFSSDISADIVIALDEAGDPKDAVEFLRSEAERISNNYPAIGYNSFETNLARDMKLEAAKQLENYVESGLKREKGAMYEVNIDAWLDELIDYDKTLGQQSPEVKKFFEDAADELNVDDAINLGFDPFEMKDGDIEKKAIELAKKRLLDPDGSVGTFLGTMASLRGSADAGESLLMSKGAKGIKYATNDTRDKQFEILLDVRGKPYGTEPIFARDINHAKQIEEEYKGKGFGVEIKDARKKNYVVFDENLIDIMRKYGLLAPMVGGAGAYGLMQEPEQSKSGLLELEG